MRRLWLILAAIASLAVFALVSAPAEALTSVTCAANVCSGSVTVGVQAVSYWYTQNHNATDSSFKVRFKSGSYSTNANPVRFKITTGSAFGSNASLKNPSPLSSMPPDQTVNAGKTQDERSATSSTAGITYDFVQELRFGVMTPGAVAVTLQVTQYGASTTVGPFNIYFDSVSPSNRDEGLSLAALYGASYRQCYDVADNDIDYRQDCADSNCTGKSISPTSVCEAAEATCNDGLDNDGNGLVDCADPLCNGKAGNAAGTKFCGPENGGTNHANCADGFDNDGNGKSDCVDNAAGTGCWKSGFQGCAATESSCTDNIDNDRDSDYAETLDANAGTGIDCRDYDCKGRNNCPTSERLAWNAGSGTFVDTPAQCFNGLDDDLDGAKDCADTDCIGAISGSNRCASFEAWLPPKPLGDGITTPAFYFNDCSDGIDNDGDGQVDAVDSDCKNVFGECSPPSASGLASTEIISFLSCADNIDNDAKNGKDCGDSLCRTGAAVGRAGCLNASCGSKYATTLTDTAACSTSESVAAVCGDGLDNDANGTFDCADANCNGQRHGPTLGTAAASFACGVETGAANCHDGADNDQDASSDCFDSGCQDGTQCTKRPATGGWTLAASCPTIPNYTALASIVSGGSVQYANQDRLYVSAPYKLRFTGSGSFTSLTIVIGDAVVVGNGFPFDAGTANCSLVGTGAASMRYASSNAKVGVITENSGATLNNFDVTLTCNASSAVPLGPSTFKIAEVANHAGAVEFGETTASVQVYESTAPTLPNPAVDAEAVVGGKVSIPVGSTVRFQALPVTDASGICRCYMTLNGAGYQTADGNCQATAGPFANDVPAFSIRAQAVDGASNLSASSTAQTVNINVLPSVSENLTLGNDTNGGRVLTYRQGDLMKLDAKFLTDTLSTFPSGSNCRVYVYDTGFVGGQAATVTMSTTAFANTLTCSGSYTVPALAAGRYSVIIEGTDSSGDKVRSNLQTFLKCENSDVGIGPCKDADFDHDGTPEGRFTPGAYPSPPTPTYFGNPQPHACDNCMNFYNPNQADTNANGVGDSCEAGAAIGRCKYKRCGSTPDDASLGPTCSSDADCAATPGDRCIVPDQTMCTMNCQTDTDCWPPNTAVVGAVCSMDWGQCTGVVSEEGNCCFTNADCLSGSCKALTKPFLQTSSGQIYSAGQVQGGEVPPVYNATFCLQSNGTITNFTSAGGCVLSGSTTYTAPTKAKNYVGSFGSIDVNGILNGKYGATVKMLPNDPLPANLAGKIYEYDTGMNANAATVFQNSAGVARANGLVIVKGDVNVNADLSYQDRNESDLKNLASIGWVILETGSGIGGNLKIAGTVNTFVGAVFAEGTIDTGNGTNPLIANGAFVAKNFALNRQYASRTAGSEQISYDARVIFNPPPGLTDATRSLPGFSAIPGQ